MYAGSLKLASNGARRVAKMMPLCIWVGGSQSYYYLGGSMKVASNSVRAKMRPLSNMHLGGW